MASVSAGEITVSVKDTETFAELLKASSDVYEWFKIIADESSYSHTHPMRRLGEVLHKLSDVGPTCEH